MNDNGIETFLNDNIVTVNNNYLDTLTALDSLTASKLNWSDIQGDACVDYRDRINQLESKIGEIYVLGKKIDELNKRISKLYTYILSQKAQEQVKQFYKKAE